MNKIQIKALSDRIRCSENWKKHIVLVVVVSVVAIVAIAGFAWHSQPSFCNAICHNPMDTYVSEYYSTTPSPLTQHEKAGIGCLGCHEATLDEQVKEGSQWVSGSFDSPLEKRSFASAEFCLKSGCHDSAQWRSVHTDLNMEETDYQCTSCHTMHTW